MDTIKRYLLCTSLFFAALSLAASSPAQSPFDGTWLIKPAQSKPTSIPLTFYTSQGWLHCVSCTPPNDVAADGADHAVTGQVFDTTNVTLVDANTIKVVNKKDGRIIEELSGAVSKDGKTLTIKRADYAQNGQVTNSVETWKRIGDLPSAGVHATSGKWQMLKVTGGEKFTTVTYRTNGDEITMTAPDGENYTAKFDGKDYPFKGDYQANTVSLKRIDAHTLEETYKRDGTVAYISKMTISPDGKSMTTVFRGPKGETGATFAATKK
jgi:hypothetical protein